MQILDIWDLKSGDRSGSWSAQTGRNYTNSAGVLTDSELVGPKFILSNLGVKVGDTYRYPLYSVPTESDPKLFIQNVTAKCSEEDGRQWVVTFEYGPYNASEQGGAGENGTIDPTKIPPKIHSGSARYEEAVTHDSRTGKPILNKAGLPFDPPLVRPVSNSVWTITRNEATWDGSLTQYENHVNVDTFLGYAPNTVKVNSVTAERLVQADFGYYWEVTYEFEIRPIIYAVDEDGNPINEDTGLPPPDDVGGPLILQNGWSDKVLNAGLLKKVGSDLKRITVDGVPVSQPVALTTTGDYDPAAAPNYIDVDRLPLLDFAIFKIPDDLLSQGVPDGDS